MDNIQKRISIICKTECTKIDAHYDDDITNGMVNYSYSEVGCFPSYGFRITLRLSYTVINYIWILKMYEYAKFTCNTILNYHLSITKQLPYNLLTCITIILYTLYT